MPNAFVALLLGFLGFKTAVSVNVHRTDALYYDEVVSDLSSSRIQTTSAHSRGNSSYRVTKFSTGPTCDQNQNWFCLRKDKDGKEFIDGYLQKKSAFLKKWVNKYFRIYQNPGTHVLIWWNSLPDLDTETTEDVKRFVQMVPTVDKFLTDCAKNNKANSDMLNSNPKTDGLSGGGMFRAEDFSTKNIINGQVLGGIINPNNPNHREYGKYTDTFKTQLPGAWEIIDSIGHNRTYKSMKFFDNLKKYGFIIPNAPTELPLGVPLKMGKNNAIVQVKVTGGGTFGTDRYYDIREIQEDDKGKKPEFCSQLGAPNGRRVCPSTKGIRLAFEHIIGPYWVSTCREVMKKNNMSKTVKDLCKDDHLKDKKICPRIATTLKQYSAYKWKNHPSCNSLAEELAFGFKPQKVGTEVEYIGFTVTSWTDKEVKDHKKVATEIKMDQVLAQTAEVAVPGVPMLKVVLEMPADEKLGAGIDHKTYYAHIECIYGPVANENELRKINGIFSRAAVESWKNCDNAAKKISMTDRQFLITKKHLKDNKQYLVAKTPQEELLDTFEFRCFVETYNTMLHKEVTDTRLRSAYTLMLPPFNDEKPNKVNVDSLFVVKPKVELKDVDKYGITYREWAQVNYGVPLSKFGDGSLLNYLGTIKSDIGGRPTPELFAVIVADELSAFLSGSKSPSNGEVVYKSPYSDKIKTKFKKLFEDARFKGLLYISIQIMMARLIMEIWKGSKGDTSGGSKNILMLLPKTGAADVLRLLPSDLKTQIHAWVDTQVPGKEHLSDLIVELLTLKNSRISGNVRKALIDNGVTKVHLATQSYKGLDKLSALGLVLVGGGGRILCYPTVYVDENKFKSEYLDSVAKAKIKEMMKIFATSERYVGETNEKYGHQIRPDEDKLFQYNHGGSAVVTLPTFRDGQVDNKDGKTSFDDVMIVLESRWHDIFSDISEYMLTDQGAKEPTPGVEAWNTFRKPAGQPQAKPQEVKPVANKAPPAKKKK